MNNLLENIFEQSEIRQFEFEGLKFYNNNDAAYYFTLDIDVNELKKIRTFEDLTNNENYRLFKKQFDVLEEKGSSNTLTKNSSLLILVEVEKMEEMNDLQHHILLIEEDEYFFKKYVILYSGDALKKLDTENILKDIGTKVGNKEIFNSFSKIGYSKDIDEYIFILQLFIKLPFLKLSFNTEDFESLANKISKILGESDELLYDAMIGFDNLDTLDFLSKETEDEIDEVLRALNND